MVPTFLDILVKPLEEGRGTEKRRFEEILW
jgi:hypothetical protein